MVLAGEKQSERRLGRRRLSRAQTLADPAVGDRRGPGRIRRSLDAMSPARVRALAAALVLVLGAAALPAAAQDERAADVDNLEVTVRLLPEGATRPDPVTRVIELPEALRSRLAEDASEAGTEAGAGEARGATADVGGDRRAPGGVDRLDDGVRTDVGEVARNAADRATELGRGQGAAASARDAAEPAVDAAAAGRDAVAAARAARDDVGAAAREQGRDSAAARDAAADTRDAAARDAARDAARAARDTGRDAADRARDGREGAAGARDAVRDAAEDAREARDAAEDAREEALRGRPDRPARPEPGRGRPDGPPGRP